MYSFQAEKDRVVADRREEVRQSDFQCVMAQYEHPSGMNGIGEQHGATNIQQKVVEYAQEREARIDTFISQLEHRRLQFISDLLQRKS